MRSLSVLFLLVACNSAGSSQIPAEPTSTLGTETTTTATTTTDTTGTTTSTTSTTTAGLVYDCNNMPAGVLGFTQLTAPMGYHDVEFDLDNNMLGANTANGADIFKTDTSGNTSLLTPTDDTIQQMVWLLDGDLAIASVFSGIQRVDPVTGGRSTINNNIQAYGLIMGPDDMLWAADEDQVWRVDPVTGDAELIIERNALDNGAPRVIAFNLANDRLYMGTRDGSRGRIYAVDLDASFNPTGQPFEFADDVGTGWGAGEYHDTMGVDICGNLYVADFWSSSLHRIDVAGNVTELADWPFDMGGMAYGHGMQWGTGIDAWSDFAIYMPQPYLDYNVIEIDIGVPSRDWTAGYAINIP